MADPTVAEVLSDAAGHLGDTAAEQFTPTVLAPFFGQAYREAFGVMIALKLPMGKRTVSPVVLAANTTSLDPRPPARRSPIWTSRTPCGSERRAQPSGTR
jgi:hypothetical protein